MTVRDGDIIHQPGPDAWETARIGAYRTWLTEQLGLRFDDYQQLWQWSVDDLDAFWRSIWDYFGVESTTPAGDVLGRREMPGAEWFPGTRVNYTTEYLRAAADRDDEIAIIGESQTREQVTYTYAELTELIARIRTGLERLGVGIGDRVVAYLPNIPETMAACLATASLGATWASAAPEFGPQAVVDRFSQLDPVVLLTVDGYRYGDKDVDARSKVTAIRAGLPSLRHTVSLSYNGRDNDDTIPWSELIAEHGALDVVPVPFDHPLFVLFSSGTTGLPKAIVHGHGGIILEAYKNHVLSWDLGVGDRLMWFTTTAWMMWNALMSTLLTGASIVCIDGNPMAPDIDEQWRIAERTRPTVMGLGPAFVTMSMKAGAAPADDRDLSSIRMFCAAGSPMPTEGFVWLHEQFPDAVLSVGSGGTDVCTGLLQGYPVVPVYAGEISAKVLGVAAYAYDDDGNSVTDELGELVITEPMPSMPVRFWGDDASMSRYRSTYYEQYPGVMRFGDWVRFTERGSSVITGRSDATLNRGGVRIGTAEIYRVVEQRPDIADSLVVHIEDPDGGMGELILFVHPSEGDVDAAMVAELRSELRSALSPRHVPDTIFGVSGVPRTLTGKKLELPVKRILMGVDPSQVVSRDALGNPEVLDAYITFQEHRP